MVTLGLSALEQLLSRQRPPLNERASREKMSAVEAACLRFDRDRRGALGVDDFYNVIRLQCGIDCSKEEIRQLFNDLDKDDKQRASIQDFVYCPLISEAVFEAMDKNKDGFVTKSELRLAQKGLSMAELSALIDQLDEDNDGRLTFQEMKAIAKMQGKINVEKFSNDKKEEDKKEEDKKEEDKEEDRKGDKKEDKKGDKKGDRKEDKKEEKKEDKKKKESKEDKDSKKEESKKEDKDSKKEESRHKKKRRGSEKRKK